MCKIECYYCKQRYSEEERKEICNLCKEIKDKLAEFLKSKLAREQTQQLLKELDHTWLSRNYEGAIIVKAGKRCLHPLPAFYVIS